MALRRLWRATQFALEHGGYLAIVSRYSPTCWVWRAAYQQGEADSLAAAQAAAEAAIEQRLARLTREEIILEAARVDCREVRS